MLIKNLTFSLRADVVVIGQDGEMADISNPRGDIFGDAYYVVATMVGTALVDPNNGLQWAHFKTFINDKAGAERLLKRIQDVQVICNAKPVLDMMLLTTDCWREIEPQYGTQAWIDWNAAHPETWND